MASLPVYYRAQKSAWMNSYLFKEWFICEFIPKVQNHLISLKLPIKALLVLDNAPTHPTELQCEGYPDIKLMFLPPNIISLSQPMDQGVIESFKRRYRRKVLSEILDKLDNEDTGLIQALKAVNIKDVVYMVAKAYDEMPSSTFTKSWKKVWPNVIEIVEKNKEGNTKPEEPNLQDSESNDNESLLQDLQRLSHTDDFVRQDVVEWIAGQDEELQNEILSDDEIVQILICQDGKQEATVEEGDNEQKMSHAEGRASLELATTYIEQQREATAVDIMFIKKWRDFAFKKATEQKNRRK